MSSTFFIVVHTLARRVEVADLLGDRVGGFTRATDGSVQLARLLGDGLELGAADQDERASLLPARPAPRTGQCRQSRELGGNALGLGEQAFSWAVSCLSSVICILPRVNNPDPRRRAQINLQEALDGVDVGELEHLLERGERDRSRHLIFGLLPFSWECGLRSTGDGQ